MQRFHPAVAAWFEETFAAPTECQLRAWQALKTQRHVLISAPTGAGKTLAAFLAAIDELVVATEQGYLKNTTQVVYVSPLRALSHDVERNLTLPLAEIQRRLPGRPKIFAQSRTGDTPKAARALMARRPPHILVTTPESLYILLTSASGRKALCGCRTVIVDEIHALVGTKRGAHLALSLERLERLCSCPLTRIGLSATVKPLTSVARFLIGAAPKEQCVIIDSGHLRHIDLDIELPDLPLQAVLSTEAAKSIYDKLADLILKHRTTLVFVNTRRQAERVALALSERLGKTQVASHHSSLSRAQRLEAEQRLKAGELKALVATASLELGIDIGEVDLVCQLGTTHSVAALLQRVGRAGHRLDKIPKGRLFPTTRNELITSLALIDSVRRGELETCREISAPLDVLAQQIVAMVACEDWDEDELFQTLVRAAPYRGLSRAEFDQVVAMLAEGYALSRGRRGAYLYRDLVANRLRARKGARLTALTCGGAIPDTADYKVMLEPTGEIIGTVDEDFAIETLAGDIFQLGNASWRVLRLESDGLRVEDAQGAPPTIPFWFGEAPGRSEVLAHSVSRLREEIYIKVQSLGLTAACQALSCTLKVNPAAIRQAAEYLAASGNALGGVMPTQAKLVVERFFDQAQDLHLVIHSPYGSRINRALGLALRKRFCRTFNFELQAAATEDALLLSLSARQSFPLEAIKNFLSAETYRELLTQAVLDNPMFAVRWRWNAVTSLAVKRFQNGRKTPPYLTRIQAEDLLIAVFPEQLACLENIQGDRQIPDHPLVRQTLNDCLEEALDTTGLEKLLRGIAQGSIELITREMVEPSPLAAEVINARVYAFLDNAPLEERRVRAIAQQRWPKAYAPARLDPKVVEQVCQELRPSPKDAEELYELLLSCAYLTQTESSPFAAWLKSLASQKRVYCLDKLPMPLWVAAQDLAHWQVIHPQATPLLKPSAQKSLDFQKALCAVLRARLQMTGPTTVSQLTAELSLKPSAIEQALLALEQEGGLLRGEFGWCERGVLARIHRLSLKTQHKAVQAVSSAQFVSFLLRWQHLHPDTQLKGAEGLAAVLAQLEGFQAPACCWEASILPARIADYDPAWLDQLCLSGRFSWCRPSPSGKRTPLKHTPIAFAPRRRLAFWISAPAEALSPSAAQVLKVLTHKGALFFDELLETLNLLPSQLENALAELIALGQVTCDSFAGIRGLSLPERQKRSFRQVLHALENAGRWQRLWGAENPQAAIEHKARCLLRRYGVVFRALAARDHALPPWLELVRVYRQLEMKGEIYRGRFVVGQSGEQFALPEAMVMLHKTCVIENPFLLSAADPLNLSAVFPGVKPVPALAGRTIKIAQGTIASGQLDFCSAKA